MPCDEMSHIVIFQWFSIPSRPGCTGYMHRRKTRLRCPGTEPTPPHGVTPGSYFDWMRCYADPLRPWQGCRSGQGRRLFASHSQACCCFVARKLSPPSTGATYQFWNTRLSAVGLKRGNGINVCEQASISRASRHGSVNAPNISSPLKNIFIMRKFV